MSPQPLTCGRTPVGVDTTRPSIARVYDYSLGGKDNYDVDRAAFQQVQQFAPRQGDLSRMNRRWLHRVVRYLTGSAGLDQILDVGAGLPTACNTHEVAQQENPLATVVYVDNDPLCTAHGRVLLEQNEKTHYVSGDFLKENTLLGNADVLQYLDLDRPIGLVVCGLLHHLDDGLEPASVMAEYIDRLPDGSYVAATNFWDPGEENPALHELARNLERAFTEMGLGSGWYRTREQQLAYFEGLELIAPGLTELENWWPAGPTAGAQSPEERLMLGGVGHKPMPAPTRIRPFRR
ncbi:SAM-dependent methyltransferase [Nocardia testacea]|uniref:SAM-dependent methyltransferase n=1 Tax=Nocardia testacea TaxID=248551 RepID=UPI003A83693D